MKPATGSDALAGHTIFLAGHRGLVDDLIAACEPLLASDESSVPVNIGPGISVAIRDLAVLAAAAIGFRGEIVWDTSRPDGAPEKRLDSSIIQRLGWSPRIDLRAGLERTYRWWLEHRGATIAPEAACAS